MIAGFPCRLRDDVRGVALIEFALVLPVLVLLFVGGFQLLDAISTYRKVTTTVRSLADLVTQSTSMTPSDADTILAAATQVMAPYSPDPAQLRITEIKIDGKGVATVAWSRSRNTNSYTPCINVPDSLLSENIKVPNTYLVLAEIHYQYTPQFASNMIGSFPFADRVLMSPRNSADIPMNPPSCG